MSSMFQGLPPIPAMRRLMPLRQWVAWKWSGRKKPPVDPQTGDLAKTDDASTWGDYNAALKRAQDDGLPGVGIVLTGNEALVGFDLDKCLNPETGEADPWVAEILAYGETYAERSPSGRGVRLFAEGHVAQTVARSDLGVEIYSTGQYVTVTGGHIAGTPYEIKPAPKTLAALLRRVGEEKETSQGGAGGRGSNDNFWGQVNRAALDGLDRWWPVLFPKAYRTGKSWRAGLTGRGLQEDVAATRDGIVDFGVHDLGDTRKGRRSPIELVIEHGAASDHAQAARWPCDWLGIDPASLGWVDYNTTSDSIAPTYPSREIPVEAVRERVEAAVLGFLAAAEHHHATKDEDEDSAPPVHAIKSTTGTGKTRTVAQAVERHRRLTAGGTLAKRPLVQFGPTHKLNTETAAVYAAHGLTAEVWRGREADDPDRPSEKMCLDLPAVKLAEEMGERIETAVCSGKDPDGNKVQCPFYGQCGYQRKKLQKPDVWLAAHQMLTHAQSAFGNVAAVIVDESFWQAAIRKPTAGLTVDELRQPPFRVGREASDADLESYRARLARAIDRHKGEPGGLRREHFEAERITPELCTEALAAEYSLKPKASIWPGMPPAARKAAAAAGKGNRHVLSRAAIWREVRDLLRSDGKVSGRIFLDVKDDAEHGRTTLIRVRGLSRIAKAWADLPTLLLDATLPAPDLIRPFYPTAQITPDLEASMPHATVRQVLGSPTASRKLAKGDASGRNIRDLRRYILKRWMEHGRQETLVIVQMEAEAKLKALGLPDTIHVEHFNNVAGIDRYRNARLLIMAGRTLPGPEAVEALAGTLSGVETAKAATSANGKPWYDRVTHGIRMADGTARAVPGDKHPDPVAEAVRWQICEGELVQALGRVRAVNRTAGDPVSIDILANVCLPVTVNEVVAWAAVEKGLGGWCETAAEGVVLASPADMAKAFPSVWGSTRAAEREAADFPANSLCRDLLKDFGGEIAPPPWLVLSYRPAGRGQQQRTAYFSPATIPVPRLWLEERLGPLAVCEQAFSPEFAALDRLFDAAPPLVPPAAPSRFACDAGALHRPCDHGSPTFRSHMEALHV